MLTYAILITKQQCTQIEQMEISTCKKLYNLNSTVFIIMISEYMLVIRLCIRVTSVLLNCKCILLPRCDMKLAYIGLI